MDLSQLPTDPSWSYVILAGIFLVATGLPTWIVLARQGSQKSAVDAIQKQVENNGGSSLKDGADRTEALLVAHIADAEVKQAATDQAIAELHAKLDRRWWRRG